MARPTAKTAPKPKPDRPDRVATAAVPAEELTAEFPEIDLPVRPPFPPMEAKPAARLRWRPEKRPDQCTFEQVRTGAVPLSKLGL